MLFKTPAFERAAATRAKTKLDRPVMVRGMPVMTGFRHGILFSAALLEMKDLIR
jgi:hypothetical protein